MLLTRASGSLSAKADSPCAAIGTQLPLASRAPLPEPSCVPSRGVGLSRASAASAQRGGGAEARDELVYPKPIRASRRDRRNAASAKSMAAAVVGATRSAVISRC